MEHGPLDIRPLTQQEEAVIADSLTEANTELAEGRTESLADVQAELDLENHGE